MFQCRVLPDLQRRQTNASVTQIIYKVEKEGIVPNSFYKVSIILIPEKENYKPIFLIR